MNLRGGILVSLVLALVGCGTGKTDTKPLTNYDGSGVGIVNGTDVTAPNSYSKHVVFLEFKMGEGGGACTGSILDSQTILTAAHCVTGATAGAIAFTTNIHDAKAMDRSLVRRVDGIAVHARFHPREESETTQTVRSPPLPTDIPTVEEVHQGLDQGGEVDYDIAVLHFSGGLPAGFTPVTLATSAAIVHPGAPMHMIGFGLSEVDAKEVTKDGVTMTVPVPKGDTVGQLRETEVPVAIYDTKVGMILTDSTKTGVCSGDSGGPSFMRDSSGADVQVGIAEAVANPYCTSVSMHTAVFPFLKWITQATAKLAEQVNASN